MMMNFKSTVEFDKEFKFFLRKFRSLEDDLEEFKKIVIKYPVGTGKHFAVLTRHSSVSIVKARFFCRYLRGSSLRIIYAYDEKIKTVEFIELYFKGDKELEDGIRIREYVKRFK